MARKKGKIKIYGTLNYEIKLDQALETMQIENLEGFRQRVKKVYLYESSFGMPELEFIAYKVFYDYYDPFIESIIEKASKTDGNIELDLIQGKSKTQSGEEYNKLMSIRLELEEHVSMAYQDFGATYLLKVKEVLDELNLSSNGKFPVVQVW
ncbi:hypothetical protein [Priestia megaterium]|uniref:hypothetical protein n=1 Tax=Priestia megaterium TaxID=1404 RepID=UPI00300B32C3